MSLKTRLSVFLVVFLAGFGIKAPLAKADSASIDPKETVGCDADFWWCFRCQATHIINCDNGQEGFINSETSLKTLKVIVTKRNGQQTAYLLTNPPGNIQDYRDVEDNKWVLSKLPRLNRRDEVEVAKAGFGLPADTPLYQDVFIDRLKGPIGESAEGGIGVISSCTYKNPPMVATMEKCGTICMVRGECDINGTKYTDMDFVCKTTRGKDCPKADKCAVDDTEIPF